MLELQSSDAAQKINKGSESFYTLNFVCIFSSFEMTQKKMGFTNWQFSQHSTGFTTCLLPPTHVYALSPTYSQPTVPGYKTAPADKKYHTVEATSSKLRI